jgi:phage protein D
LIYELQDRSSPGFWIAIQTPSGPRRVVTGGSRGIGEPLPSRAANVLSFEFTDSEKKSDVLKLTVDNYNLHHFDDPVWQRGNIIVVGWGYEGRESPARELVITKVTGSTTLTIEAKSKAIFMDRVVKNRTFSNMKRSEVVTQLAEENGFGSLHIEDTRVTHPSISQVRKTDAQFIRYLADREGFQFYVDFAGFHFHRRQTGERPIRRFRWFTDPFQGDVLSFDVESDITQKPAATAVAAHDPDTGQTVNHVASTSESSGATTPQLSPRYVTVEQGNRRWVWPTNAPAAQAGTRPPLDANGASRRALPNEDVLTELYTPDTPPSPAAQTLLPTPREAETTELSRGGTDPAFLDELYGDNPPEERTLNRPLPAQDPTSSRDRSPRPTQTVTGQEPGAVRVNQANRRWTYEPPVSATSETPTEDATVQCDVRPTSTDNPQVAAQEAQASHDRMQHMAVKLKLKCVGDPEQYAKTIIQLEGFGRFLSVRYYVKEVVHSIGSGGYTMSLTCVSDGHGGHSTSSEVAPGLEFGSTGHPAAASNQQEAPIHCSRPLTDEPMTEAQRVMNEVSEDQARARAAEERRLRNMRTSLDEYSNRQLLAEYEQDQIQPIDPQSYYGPVSGGIPR